MEQDNSREGGVEETKGSTAVDSAVDLEQGVIEAPTSAAEQEAAAGDEPKSRVSQQREWDI